MSQKNSDVRMREAQAPVNCRLRKKIGIDKILFLPSFLTTAAINNKEQPSQLFFFLLRGNYGTEKKFKETRT
jgi:hypothetical protein